MVKNFKARMRSKPAPELYEVEIAQKNGNILPVEASVSIKKEGKKTIGIVATIRDITERKKAEEALRQSEEKWRLLVENVPDIIMNVNRKGTILAINRVVIPGVSVEEVIGKSIYDYMPSKYAKTVKKSLDYVFRTGKTDVYEILGTGPKGSESAWYETRVVPIKQKNKVTGVIQISMDITERKKAEEALYESENRYRTLFEKSPISITLIDKKGVIIDCNKSTEKLIGFSKKEIFGKPFEKLLTLKPEDLPKLKNIYNKLLEGHKVKPYKLEIIGKDGEKRIINVTTSLVKRGNEAVGFQVIARDITESELAEQALKESEELYRTLVETSPDAITFTDLDTNIIMLSPKGFKDLGYDNPEELIGKSAFDLMDPEDKPRISKYVQEIIETGKVKNAEFNLLKKDGSKVPIEFNASLILDEKGEPKAFLGISRDITERKKTEIALRESEEKYSNLFQKSNDAIVIHDLEGNILDVNQRVLDFFGYSKDEIMKVKIAGLHPKRELKKSKKAFKSVAKDGFVNFEIDFKKKNGEIFHAEVSSSLFEIGGKQVVQGIVRDITERRKAEEALQESEERYRHIFEKSPIGIGLATIDGEVVTSNKAMGIITGYTEKEFKKINLIDTYENMGDRLELVEVIKRNGGVVDFPVRLKRKDGTPYEALLTVTKVNIGGKDFFQTICQDITERKKAEEEIKKLKEFNESIVQSMDEGIMIMDEEGYITFVNPKIEKMLDYKRTKLVGEHWSDIFARDYHRRVRDSYAENLRGKHDRFEAVLVKKNRTELPVMISASPQFKDDAFNGILAVLTDISDRKKEDIAREELMRYKLKRGSTYLIEEKELDKGKDVVYELYKNHFNGVIITREHPEKMSRDIELKLPLFWMTNDPKDKMSVRPEFPLLEKIIDDNIDRDTFVFLDRFDYLVTQNNFKDALNFVQHLNEIFYTRRGILIISLDPDTLTPQELSLLEKETTRLEVKREEKLTADLMDLLEFVHSRNRVGDSPSYKQIGDEFRISRTTTRKRIRDLIDKALMIERKSGRFKYLFLTEKGKDLI